MAAHCLSACVRATNAQTFVKTVNFQHMMPTRYTLDVDLKNLVTPEALESATKKVEARKVRMGVHVGDRCCTTGHGAWRDALAGGEWPFTRGHAWPTAPSCAATQVDARLRPVSAHLAASRVARPTQSETGVAGLAVCCAGSAAPAPMCQCTLCCLALCVAAAAAAVLSHRQRLHRGCMSR